MKKRNSCFSFKSYVIKFVFKKDYPRFKNKSWQWNLRVLPDKRWKYTDYKEAREELKEARKKFPDCVFRLIKIEEKNFILKV